MSKVRELFGINTLNKDVDWEEIISEQHCPYIDRKCIKTRKSQPEIAIGTCTMSYGRDSNDIIICPHRLLERKQIFMDCIHLLTKHVPGNELHLIPEMQVPGGYVDYFLVSVKDNKVKDFVGIELQTMDTTGTVWPERERLLKEIGMPVDEDVISSKSRFGMNWKMTAKTILVQLHHKIKTFQHVNKHLVLVLQEPLLDYMEKSFNFTEVGTADISEPLHFHSYSMEKKKLSELKIALDKRLSTDVEGMNVCLGLQEEAKIDLSIIIEKLESRISSNTLFTI